MGQVIRKFAGAVILTAAMALQATAATTTWQIDPAHTAASFAVKHLMISTVRGEFKGVTGTVVWDDKDVTKSAVDVTIDAKTVNTGEPNRDKDLRSDKFFDTEKFPTASFKILTCKKTGDDKNGHPMFDVTGSLTLKGITNSITIPATVAETNDTLVIHSKFKFDRTKWNIRYNSGKFFSDIGNGAISDAIGMEIDLVAVKDVRP
jgi:polyisoprenoid-binding protein YceI